MKDNERGLLREFGYPDDAPWWTFVLYTVAIVVMVLGVFIASAFPSQVERTDPRMPSVEAYPILNEGYVGSLPCGRAFLEVRGTSHPDEFVIVWYLNKHNLAGRGKVLAVVFTHDGYHQTFLDVNQDGLWDSVKISKPGERSAADLYSAVQGCGDGWFK